MSGHSKTYPDLVTYAGDRYCVVWNDYDGANSEAWERRFVLGGWSAGQKLYDANAMAHCCPRVCRGSTLRACRASGTQVASVTTGADTTLMDNIAPFVSAKSLAWAWDGTRSYLVVASNAGAYGQVFLKRTDATVPTSTCLLYTSPSPRD